MAIPEAELKLRSGDSSLVFINGSFAMTKRWEVYHDTMGEVVASGQHSRPVAVINRFDDADEDLEARCAASLMGVQERHKGIGAIGGYSAWDTDLILDGWMQDEDGLHHPILGDLAVMPAGLVVRINAILAARLGPPTWFWAEPGGSAGELRVKCVAVPGADSYNVYDGETLLGNVATSGWETISGLSAGTYNVRMGAVDGGQLGILSFAASVEVS